MIWTLLFAAFMLKSSAEANLALGKPASMDSEWGGNAAWTADRAVDGDTTSDIYQGSCAHNSGSSNDQAYWQVDLEDSYDITSVKIYNRMDCCSYRLANTRVIISDTAAFEDGTECGFIGEEGNDPEVTVTCAVIGRYVTLQRDAAGEEPYIINICEVEVEGQQARTCRVDEAAYDYQGTISVTKEGIECQAWSSDEPHSHGYDEDSYFVDGSVAAAENFCRNPDNSESDGPWCYTTDSGTRWDHCDIPICITEDCKYDQLGLGYMGRVSVTRDGTECQAWASQEPNSHGYDEDDMFVDGSVAAAENFCRNPDGDESDGPWCYTMGDERWDWCDIPIC